jgi:hypothetical protein
MTFMPLDSSIAASPTEASRTSVEYRSRPDRRRILDSTRGDQPREGRRLSPPSTSSADGNQLAAS